MGMRSLFSWLHLRIICDRLRGSYWFLPSLMAAAAAGLSFGMTGLDAALDRVFYADLAVVNLFGPEGARAILAAIAGSMITVAGLTFSITMLTLQVATSQFGPRLLRNFMRDRGNQAVLGTFIGTFVYCLLVMRTIRGVEGASFVPHLAVAVGILLALVSLAVLIYFIHHIALSIRIETILSSLAAETEAAIERLYPDRLGRRPAVGTDRASPDFAEAHLLRSAGEGYVQAVDGSALVELARCHGLVVKVVARPGSFVTAHDGLLLLLPPVEPAADVAAELRGTFAIGNERTPDQDLAFSVRRIVEIAQRALSPGINDPTTALYCVDRLRQAFGRLAGREAPAATRLDDEGNLRVVAEPASFDELACDAFAAVMRHVGNNVDVAEALLRALDHVIGLVGPERGRNLAALRFSARRASRSSCVTP
jgi:uncharacterized membrane protein